MCLFALRATGIFGLQWDNLQHDIPNQRFVFYGNHFKTGTAVITVSRNTGNPYYCPYSLVKMYYDRVPQNFRFGTFLRHPVRSRYFGDGNNFRDWYYPPNAAFSDASNVTNTLRTFLRQNIQFLPEDVQLEELTGILTPFQQKSNMSNDKLGVSQFEGGSGRKFFGKYQSFNPYTSRKNVIKGKWKSEKIFDQNYVQNNPEWQDYNQDNNLYRHFNDLAKKRGPNLKYQQQRPNLKRRLPDYSTIEEQGPPLKRQKTTGINRPPPTMTEGTTITMRNGEWVVLDPQGSHNLVQKETSMFSS